MNLSLAIGVIFLILTLLSAFFDMGGKLLDRLGTLEEKAGRAFVASFLIAAIVLGISGAIYYTIKSFL